MSRLSRFFTWLGCSPTLPSNPKIDRIEPGLRAARFCAVMTTFVSTLYRLSPAFVQNLGVSWYGWKLRRREYNDDFFRSLAEFTAHERWSAADMQAWQEDRLRTLISHAYENVPYYRQVFDQRKLKPADVRSLADLPKLPTMSRDTVREQQERLLSRTVHKRSLPSGRTTGTSGSPLVLYWDNHLCAMKNVVDWRQKQWAGLKFGDRLAIFSGREVVPNSQKKPPFWRHNWALNHLFCSSFHMSPANLELYFEALKRFQPRALEGWPSAITILAGFLNSRGRTFPLSAVFSSSEPLLPTQRAAIEQAFACKVFDAYGMAERVVFATECEQHTSMHLNPDFGITELLGKDGRSAPAGQIGRIVATSLHNFAMPLIRYATSDVTALESGSCPCGRNWPQMQNITTRGAEIISTADGRYMPPGIFARIIDHVPGIAESQVIQDSRYLVRVRIVPRAQFGPEQRTALAAGFRHALGQGMDVEIETTATIERTPTGKFQFVKSHVPLEF